MNTIYGSNLEGVWARREEDVYPANFGVMSRDIFTLTQELFDSVFEQRNCDPRWLFCGVFEFAPSATRDSWLYVTSGLSNPWDVEPSDYVHQEFSGLAMEFVLESETQADWPIHLLLRLMAYNLLLSAGVYGEPSLLGVGHRVPLGLPITPESTTGDLKLNHIVIGQAEHYPNTFILPSGKVFLLQMVGITEQERDLAKQTSSLELIQLLTKQGFFPVTKPSRASIV